jgi:predicted permease
MANLLLARSMRRSRVLSIRIALGAGRWRIVRQLLIESLMLSGIGGIFGWWMASSAVRLYTVALNGAAVTDETGSWFDTVLDYSMDYRVLVYLVAISVGTGILFGLAPSRRLSKLEVNGSLKNGGRGAVSEAGGTLSSVLVIGEMALVVVLLAGASMMIRSFLNIYTADVGVETGSLLTMRVAPPVGRFRSADAHVSFYDRIERQLEAIPEVESLAIASSIPGGGAWGGAGLVPYELDGALFTGERRPSLRTLITGTGYFRTIGATLFSGREFTDADDASAIPVVVVNQRFAAESWPGENPLGKRLRLFDGQTAEEWRTVVGVVPNVWQNTNALHQFDPLIYIPFRQRPAGEMWIIGRTRVPPGRLAPTFWREAQAVDPELLIAQNPLPLDQRLVPASPFRAFIAVLFLILAAVALLLASVGLYAVVAHTVSARTQEFGIRSAMGATARDILILVFSQGIRVVGAGLALGLAVTSVTTPLLRSQLVEVAPSDPISLSLASALLVLSAALGCWIPERRAARVDPVVALRSE